MKAYSDDTHIHSRKGRRQLTCFSAMQFFQLEANDWQISRIHICIGNNIIIGLILYCILNWPVYLPWWHVFGEGQIHLYSANTKDQNKSCCNIAIVTFKALFFCQTNSMALKHVLSLISHVKWMDAKFIVRDRLWLVFLNQANTKYMISAWFWLSINEKKQMYFIN